MPSWLELEEQVGFLWHRLISRNAESYPRHPEAAVTLKQIKPMLTVLFRTLGGDPGVDLAPAGQQSSHHRLKLRQKLGLVEEHLPAAALGEASLHLPEQIDVFPEADLNRDLYVWLAAFFSAVPVADTDAPDDPFVRDLRALWTAYHGTRRALAAYPGLRKRYDRLAGVLRRTRPDRVPHLPPTEAAVEGVVLWLLASDEPLPEGARAIHDAVTAGAAPTEPPMPRPKRYRPFLPVPLWGTVADTITRSPPPAEEDEDDATEPAGDPESDRRHNAERKRQDQAERADSLIIDRFEKILAMAEMINVNRDVEDSEVDEARKAANDLDQITVSPHQRRAATRLRLDLDLPPTAVAHEQLTGTHTYPEWDFRTGTYHPDHVRVLTGPAPETGESWQPDADARQRIRRVRRQFEALRPRQEILRRQPDGEDPDLEAAVRAKCDFQATGESSENVYLRRRNTARDLSVALLMDVSLSTDAWVHNRRILDVAKEALFVFVHGLAACGDDNAVYTFTSRKRHWVRVQTVKGFDETLNEPVRRRIAALRPGYYTRIGGAIRHTTECLAERPNRNRLMLVLTDGKPNDVDHYEGRYGVEDTRRAIREARRQGMTVFGITIDRKAEDYIPYLFGRHGYTMVPDPADLPRALPRIYRQLLA